MNAAIPAPSPAGSDTRPDAERRALAGLALCTVLPSLNASSAPAALPALAESFGTGFAAVQPVVLAYLLATTALIVGVGRIGDRVGRRRLLLAGIVVFTFASAACAGAPSLMALVAARTVQGAAAAVLMALGLAMAGDVTPRSRLGRTMGLLGTLSAIGTAIGPTLAGALVGVAGWPAVFAVNVPLGALAFALAWRGLPRDETRAGRPPSRFDTAGLVAMTLTLAAAALALARLRAGFGAIEALLVLAALVGAIALWHIEARASEPLLDAALLAEPGRATGLALSMLVSAVLMATLVVGPFYLSGALGLQAAAIGAVMTLGPLTAALVGVPAGRLIDRVGPTGAVGGGIAAMFSACVGLALARPDWGVTGYAAPLVLLTAGYAVFQAANNTAVMAGVAPDRRGVLSGLLSLSRQLGLLAGASVLGMVYASASARGAAAGLHAAFAGAAVLQAAAGLLAVRAARCGRPGRRARPPAS